MAAELRVFLTADIGPANAILGAGHETDARWDETEAGLAVALDVLRSLQDRTGAEVPVTWFFRADGLIEQQFGDCLGIFQKFSSFVEQARSEGHEVAWMPQAYVGASDDAHIDYDDLATTHAGLLRAGHSPKSVRMGNCFHDNRTMKLLDDLGIQVDSSAVPGRTKADLGWRMDWQGTPTGSYHPSLADYRRPGAPALRILEVPLSVQPIKAPYDSAPLLRYVNPCMHRTFFGQNLPATIASSPYLVLIFHPDEAVAPHAGPGHPLVAYSKAELAFNLALLLDESARLGRTLSFHRLEELAGQPAVCEGGA